jgi:hypothetical protein
MENAGLGVLQLAPHGATTSVPARAGSSNSSSCAVVRARLRLDRVRLRFDGRVVRLPEASPLGVAKLGDHSLNPRLTLGSVVAIDTHRALYRVSS